MKITTKGSGFVSQQSTTKGQKVSKNDKIEVTLSSEAIDGQSSEKQDSEKDSKDSKDS